MTHQKFETIQLLRGVAAFLVIAMHALHGVEAEGFHWHLGALLFSKGLIGVDIFFVISGFVIFYIAFRNDRPAVMQFLANRFWRIFPPYWAVLIFTLCLFFSLAIVFGDNSRVPSLRELFISIFLIPAAPKSYVIGVAWTLGLELAFYALFAVVALKYGARAFFAALISWYGLSMGIIFVLGDGSRHVYALFNPVILEFLYGTLIAYALLSGGTKYHRPAFAVGIGAVLAILIFNIDTSALLRREFIYGIPAALLIYGAVGMHIRWPKTVILWGESSYLVYLLHLPLYMLIGRGLEVISGFNIYSNPNAAFGMVVLVSAIAMVLTKWVEIPYQKAYKTRLKQV